MNIAEEVRQELWLNHHLQYNHYPPIDLAFIPVAKQAIEKANQEDWDYIIQMPNGIKKTVAEIIEGLHLGEFLSDGVD